MQHETFKLQRKMIEKEETMGTEDNKKENLDGEIDDRAKAFTPIRNQDREIEIVDDDILNEINATLAQQIQNEMTDLKAEESAPEEVKKKRFPLWAKITSSVIGVILCIAIVLFATPWGRSQVKKLVIYFATEYAYSKMDYDDGSEVAAQDPTEDIDTTETDSNDSLNIMWGNSGYDGSGRHEDYVINILLLGEEAIGSGVARGRTDLMMIATMNLQEKSVKLTSIMRDTLVQIPDYNGKSYQDNKLNSAYEIGGIQLLYETIALNFDIALDGYALVGFDDFEEIIDAVGGVEVTLSETEANYLNSTNYISNPTNRNVVVGTQTLNGNQALGFCRVRHVPTVDDQHYDYGRTSRQRVVLNAIFDKCMDLNTTQLVLLMNKLLQYVTTDITKDQFRNYLEIGLSLDVTDIENARIPAEDTYEEGYERGMAVLIPDLDANIKILHSFIFNDELEEGLNDGVILDGVDHLNAIEEKKKAEAEGTDSTTYGDSSSGTSGTTGTNGTTSSGNTSSYSGTTGGSSY